MYRRIHQCEIFSQPRIALSLLYELAHKANAGDMVFIQGLEEQAASRGGAGALPPDHPVFDERVSMEYGEFLFTTQVECPIYKR